MKKIKVICPKCGEIVGIDADEEVVICEKCAKPFITEKAERVQVSELVKLICPKCGAVNTVDAEEDAAICEKCAKPFVTAKAQQLEEPKGVLVICPKCGETVCVDPSEEVVICEKCAKPFITEKAKRATETPKTDEKPAGETVNEKPKTNDGPTDTSVGETVDDTPSSSPKTDFKYASDGGIAGYLGKGGDVVIPDGVSSIKQYAFVDVPFTTVYVPGSVKQIGLSAFAVCRQLTKVTIGRGVKEIKPAFGTCNALRELIFEDPDGWYISEYVANGAMGHFEETPVDLSDPKQNAKLVLESKRHITLCYKK